MTDFVDNDPQETQEWMDTNLSADTEEYQSKTKEFETVDALAESVIESGMDPNYEITKNGKQTYQKAICPNPYPCSHRQGQA